ncbi:MAG: nucleotidyltransferase domain-containing protein [Candidatus Poribacteria bacterium]|nr:nucleotidyltransferase domain-containing protein [Candidatus Poribacteria bacterium]
MTIPDLEVLIQVFRKYPEIQAVYLFGSVASKKTHVESDLDLGIVPQSESFHQRRLEILADLARYGFCNVDLVFLDTDDIVLKYEVVRQNRVIYQTEDFDRGEMYSKIVRQYLDFLPYLEVQRQAYKRRLLDGQT